MIFRGHTPLPVHQLPFPFSSVVPVNLLPPSSLFRYLRSNQQNAQTKSSVSIFQAESAPVETFPRPALKPQETPHQMAIRVLSPFQSDSRSRLGGNPSLAYTEEVDKESLDP